MSTPRTSHARKSLAGTILTCWLFTCFFMLLNTVPRAADPGETALVTTYVTATVSSRLRSLFETLVSPRKPSHHIVGYKAPGSSEISSTSSGVYSTQTSVDATPSTPAVLCCRRIYLVYTNLRKENVLRHWSFHTPVRVVTLHSRSCSHLISEHGNVDTASGS